MAGNAPLVPQIPCYIIDKENHSRPTLRRRGGQEGFRALQQYLEPGFSPAPNADVTVVRPKPMPKEAAPCAWGLDDLERLKAKLLDTAYCTDHFNEVCLTALDAPEGQRTGTVLCTSEGLYPRELWHERGQYVMDLDVAGTLDAEAGRKSQLVTDYDDQGHELTFLVMFDRLRPANRKAGNAPFLLVSLVEITDFVNLAIGHSAQLRGKIDNDGLWQALVDDVRSWSVESFSEPGLLSNSPVSFSASDLWLAIVRDDQQSPGPSASALARPLPSMDAVMGVGAPPECSPSRPTNFPATRRPVPVPTEMDSLLHEFSQRMLGLYSNCLVLTAPPDRTDFQIAFVSDPVGEQRGDLDTYLQKTAPAAVKRLKEALGGTRRFSLEARVGGAKGEKKRLYCVPMFGHEMKRWLCMLVDTETPLLWN